MPGKYYAKHTLNHLIDNQQKNTQKNNGYLAFSKKQAINYLCTAEVSYDEKIEYLRNLQQNNYRMGRKYKYECNLNDYEIKQIIKSAGDDKLFRLYFGKSIEEDNNNTKILTFIVLIVLLLLFGLCLSTLIKF